jgi:hypothetical protein
MVRIEYSPTGNDFSPKTSDSVNQLIQRQKVGRVQQSVLATLLKRYPGCRISITVSLRA